MNTRLANMLKEGIIPHRGGVWIDCYNQSVSDIAGTILAGITDKNHYFVTMETQILTHMRTEEGKELRRHGIDSRNNDVLTPRHDGTSNALTSFYKDNLVAESHVLGWSRDENGEIRDWHPVEIANTQTPCNRDNTQNYVAEPINPMEDGVSRTIKAQYDQTSVANFKRGDAFAATPVAANDGMKLRIRKLTERECFRLMDVPDSYIDKMQSAGISRHQQYKLAGNSIVVNCMFLIFKNLFIGCEEQPQQLTLF